jgi:hypothetical protein
MPKPPERNNFSPARAMFSARAKRMTTNAAKSMPSRAASGG